MLAQMTDSYPRHVLLVGCQPEELEDYGGSLRDSVKAVLPQALEIALEQVAAWGGSPRRRAATAAGADAVLAPMIALQAYEAGRPSAAEACRIGDARFMPVEG